VLLNQLTRRRLLIVEVELESEQQLQGLQGQQLLELLDNRMADYCRRFGTDFVLGSHNDSVADIHFDNICSDSYFDNLVYLTERKRWSLELLNF
jgi:hypothetical protein